MKPNVLVVDDEADVRFIIKSLLKPKGLIVTEAGTLRECITKLGAKSVDAVILDIDLPDGSGLDAIPQIKAKQPQATVIMNSALNTAENRSKAEALGADDFLAKPLNKRALFDALKL